LLCTLLVVRSVTDTSPLLRSLWRKAPINTKNPAKNLDLVETEVLRCRVDKGFL